MQLFNPILFMIGLSGGAAWHPYEFKCKDFACNHNVSAPLTAKYPIFVTEWAPGFPQSNNSVRYL